jgi:hypothetical protein
MEKPFKRKTGWDLGDFLNAMECPEHYVCRKCGCEEVEYQSGFPGETFIICAECKEIISEEFNESAIM